MSSLNRGAGRWAGAIVFALAWWAACAGSAAYAAQAPKVARIALVSVSSLSQVAGVAKELGVELPVFLTKEGIEPQLPLVGVGGLDEERPIGVAAFAGPGLEPGQPESIAYLLPVKREAVTLKSLYDAGGKAVEPGVVRLGENHLRRTDNYLIVGRNEKAVASLREADVVDLYKRRPGAGKAAAEEAIVRATLDVAAYRQAAPEKFNALLDQLKLAAAIKLGGVPYARDAALGLVQDIARLDLALVTSGQDAGLRLGLSPARVPAGGTFPKPGMPQEVILRFDMGDAPSKVFPWLESVLPGSPQPVAASARGRNGAAPPQKAADLPHGIADILLSGEASSLGIAPQNDTAVFYMVQQHVRADPGPRFKQLAEQANLGAAYSADKAKASKMEFSQYTLASGPRVARLKLLEGEKVTFCVDAVRRGDTVFLAGSPDQGRYLAQLLDLKPEGQFSGLLSGAVGLGAVLSIVEDAVSKNGVPPQQLKALHKLFNGRFLTVSATGEPDELVLGLSVPRDLVRDLLETFYAKNRRSE